LRGLLAPAEEKFSQKGHSMREAVIVSAARTPVGRYMGALHDIPAYDLAALVLNEVLKRCGCKAEAVDEVIFGLHGHARAGYPAP